MADYTNEEKSKYHGSFQYLERLNSICSEMAWITANRDNKIKDIKINYAVITSFYKELRPMMTGKWKKLKKPNDETFSELKYILGLVLKDVKKKYKTNIDILGLFDQWEMELRDFQADRGLLMQDKEKERRATRLGNDDDEQYEGNPLDDIEIID